MPPSPYPPTLPPKAFSSPSPFTVQRSLAHTLPPKAFSSPSPFTVQRSLALALAPSLADPAALFCLVQEVYPGDPYAAATAEAIPTFRAYAASGAAEGPVAYANYGCVENFEALASLGVNLTRAMVLARYGKIYRDDIVRNTEDAGAAVTVIYMDAKDYGGGAGGKPFPEGLWMPPSDVQIGSMYKCLGNPTTLGWACPSARWRWRYPTVKGQGRGWDLKDIFGISPKKLTILLRNVDGGDKCIIP